MLKNPNSSIWTQLKAPNNNKIEYLNALDAKFMDHDINIILMRMFGNKHAEAKYQKYGWMKTECKFGKSGAGLANSFEPMKKLPRCQIEMEF
jgi:hypothetical protein